MLPIKISDLKSGDVFLTKTSKLLVFGWRERKEGVVIAYRYANRYYTEDIKDTEDVYLMKDL